MREQRVVLMLVAIVLLTELNSTASGVPDPLFNTSANAITLKIDFGNGTVQEFFDIKGENVYEVTNSATSVEVEWYGDLVYVVSISGVHEDADANLFWQYWVNGELGGTAANKYLLADGDEIEWRLPSQTSNEPTDMQFDASIVIGGSLVGVTAIVVLFILKIKQQRN